MQDFASKGGLVITIGDWAQRQDANRNTGLTATAKSCPSGTTRKDALSWMCVAKSSNIF